MNNTDILALNINSNAFENMKSDFDKVLRRTLGNMQSKESKEATLTVKLSISLTEAKVPDLDSPSVDAMRIVLKPRFDHKVSSVMQIKAEESGSLKGEYELIWDDESQDFVMKPIDNGQSSLFDEENNTTEYATEAVVAEITANPEVPALPAPVVSPDGDYEYDDAVYGEEYDEESDCGEDDEDE